MEMYKKLAGVIGAGGSERLARLWSILCGEDEARVMLAMPATVEKIAEKTGMSADAASEIIKSLFRKGVAFERVKDGVSTWQPPKNLIQFHDASILWPEAPAEFLAAWKEFMEEEFPAFMKMIASAGLGPFMRVVPVNRVIEGGAEVLPYEHAASMIRDAKTIAVTDCTCRKTMKKCDAPLEACIQLDKGAEYSMKRGTGRSITKEEALKILDVSEAAGLIHVSENRSRIGNVLCNCCPCCCMALEPMITAGVRGFAAPSRYAAAVDASACNGCGICEDRCHFSAISMSDSVAAVDGALCIGCGLCCTWCEPCAISLSQVRPKEFIP